MTVDELWRLVVPLFCSIGAMVAYVWRVRDLRLRHDAERRWLESKKEERYEEDLRRVRNLLEALCASLPRCACGRVALVSVGDGGALLCDGCAWPRIPKNPGPYRECPIVDLSYARALRTVDARELLENELGPLIRERLEAVDLAVAAPSAAAEGMERVAADRSSVLRERDTASLFQEIADTARAAGLSHQDAADSLARLYKR